LKNLGERGVKILRDDGPFNYSALNNRAVAQATGEVLGFLNNDLKLITPDWLEEMVSHAIRPEVGAVGAMLYFPNDRVQHAGIVLGIAGPQLVNGIAGHAFKYFPRGHTGMRNRLRVAQNYSAVTAACLLVRREVFLQAGGFDEKHLAVAYNDVDFCLRLGVAGYRNVWTPFAEFYHDESASRGADDTPAKKALHERECAYMRHTWGALLDHDPAYNPNLTLVSEDFAPRPFAQPTTVNPVPAIFMQPRFYIDVPAFCLNRVLYSPVVASGWFIDERLHPAARISAKLGQTRALGTPVNRPDVVEHFHPVRLPDSNVGFTVQLSCTPGRHRLTIEAETVSGEIIPLLSQWVTVKSWPPVNPHGLRGWLTARRNRRAWAALPTSADSVLVLIPVKPGTAASVVEHARALATRALAVLPSQSRIVFDERGKAASRNEHPWRIAALAAIRQAMIDYHLRDERWVFWVDLDIVDYSADLISTLIRRSEGGIAAPMIFMADATAPTGGPLFFDTAGFVEQGRWAEPHPPYFRQPGPVYDLDSVGCCYLVPAEIYRRGARHEEDPGSRHWIELHGASSDDTPHRDWKDISYTDHYSVCAFARQQGLPVRAFADLIVTHEDVR
jgi:hypothetical protein